MLRIEGLQSAADEFLAAALLGNGWEHALAMLSVAAAAHGAVLVRCKNHKAVSSIKTADIREIVDDYEAGKAPPNSRQVRASRDPVRGFREKAFRIDHDDYTAEELASDPYYQEFLRPRGYFWHANVRLDSRPGEEVALSLKRAMKAGPYEQRDAVMLNAILRDLRVATRVAKRMLDSETAGMVTLLQQRGDPVIEFDASGQVLRTHGAGESAYDLYRTHHRRVVAHDRARQPALDRAIAQAVAAPRQPALVPLSDARGETRFLQILPVVGRARDVFLAAAAIAVVIDGKARSVRSPVERAMLRDTFALTDREADVAILLREGLSPAEMARELQIQIGTLRDHVKKLFDKSGTRRQAELVALLARIRP
jgi:DNA-binding CsgD family transcriptional regulator